MRSLSLSSVIEIIIVFGFFQEKDIRQLLCEVRELEGAASVGAGGELCETDSPKLAALKQQNSKLHYRISHLQRVCSFTN